MDRKEDVLVTDYGTNAEMALKVGDEIITGRLQLARPSKDNISKLVCLLPRGDQ